MIKHRDKMNMLTIQPIKFNTLNRPANGKNNYVNKPSKDFVSFSGYSTLGTCPKELLNVSVAALSKDSKNVLEICDIGFLAEIIKYFSPETKKTYAIKRAWNSDKIKQPGTDQLEMMKAESQIYKKLADVKKVPKFYFYKGNFTNNENSELDNYMILSWIDGKMSSSKGISYDHKLVNPKTVSKIYEVLYDIDNAGVIHNDLWAGNILFTKRDVNIIDFNRAKVFDVGKDYKQNNLESFKTRFLDRYLSDLYSTKGEKELVSVYEKILKSESKYYAKKSDFYKRNKNHPAADYYKNKRETAQKILTSKEMIKKSAIRTVLTSDLHCADVHMKHFEFGSDETKFHLLKAKSILKSYPQDFPSFNMNMLETNIMIADKLNNIINNEAKIGRIFLNKILSRLNDRRIYSISETEKSYYKMVKSFCDFYVKYQINPNRDFADKFPELFESKIFLKYFENLKSKQ